MRKPLTAAYLHDFKCRATIKRNAWEHQRKLYTAANVHDMSHDERAHKFEGKWLRFTQDLHHFPLHIFAGVGVRSIL